ncbi:MAG: imidazole glycerol phosphate synthase subunit HisF [Candidatus Melainabacteria bacterium]|nr:imidazole glycerol phosphate synthase subunit HisF [Candidatus Melainabacteria bacterium]
MLTKRIIPCLDVDSHGRTVKGVQFQGLRDVGDPLEMALRYQEQGADELLFLDISASHEGRETMVSLVERLSEVLMIPFTVGGGISSLQQVLRLLSAGADKVSVNTAAVQSPSLISEIADACGRQCCVLAIDARFWKRTDRPVWQVLTRGGRTETSMDAFLWASQAVELGAGEILLTSWDRDGTRSGFDLELNRYFSDNLSVPVIASGGAAGPQSFVEVFAEGNADAALAASIFHDGEYSISQLKDVLHNAGIAVRVL